MRLLASKASRGQQSGRASNIQRSSGLRGLSREPSQVWAYSWSTLASTVALFSG